MKASTIVHQRSLPLLVRRQRPPLRRAPVAGTPLPRITINAAGYPQMEPLETRDLPQPPDDDFARDSRRACALFCAVFILVATMAITMLVLRGTVVGLPAESGTEQTEDRQIIYKPSTKSSVTDQTTETHGSAVSTLSSNASTESSY
ncbi:uncharacterized protein LOC144134667 [Amblyomma americanum]